MKFFIADSRFNKLNCYYTHVPVRMQKLKTLPQGTLKVIR